MPGMLQLACHGEGVEGMIELFLSSDGKHTIHASAETPAELAEVGAKAKVLYEKIIGSFSDRTQMWQLAIDKGPARVKKAREIPPRAQNRRGGVPVCPMHSKPMRLRHGKYGSFWSCAVRNPNGLWCQVTKEVNSHGEGPEATA
jgi:hypothetical protein